MDLYVMYESPYCRSVIMTAKLLNLDLNIINYNLSRGEHLNEDFKKVNPRRCVPTLVDNGFALWESRAIMTYLVNKYAPNSPLYPSDPVLRAQVDQYLYFDLEKLAMTSGAYIKPLFFQTLLKPECLEDVKKSLELLDSFLTDKKFLVNDQLTLADIAAATTLSGFVCFGEDFADYKAIQKWQATVKEALPFFDEVNTEPVKHLCEVFQAKLKEAKSKTTA